LIYQYRYTDILGKRRTVYSSDLKELREKEKKLQRSFEDGIDYTAGEITVIELLERYISLKQGVRYNTQRMYDSILRSVKKEDFGYRKIRDIKVSDVKRFFIKLHNDGKRYNSVLDFKKVLNPAFQMAYDEDIIRRNPFHFKLTDVIPNDSQKRVAMTDEQQKMWMDFVREDAVYCKYYDEFVVLLGTGVRVSELCGLTKNDLDFKNRRIRVDHQLAKEHNGKYYIQKTKTEHGVRFIPMTDDVYKSLKNILINRKKVKLETVVDGYRGFILLNSYGRPKVSSIIEWEIRSAMKKYKKLHPDNPLPHITPHVFRHTFCTNMANLGMDVKTLQYLMGHSNISITLDVYTHANYERVAQQMKKIVNFNQGDKLGQSSE